MSGPLTDKRFSDFPQISPETLATLGRLGFEFATPVQAATLPLFCGNKDVAVDACTGSGKTLAFVVPIAEKLRRLEARLKKHQVGAIVISPTRELAQQIFEVMVPFVDSIPDLKAALLIGGTDTAKDVASISKEGANILVGTPGRIEDILCKCPFVDVRPVEVLVLDEADRLLDMGFEQSVLAVISKLPKQRRTGLFSATQTDAVEALVKAGLRNPLRVKVAVASEKAKGMPASVNKTPSSLSVKYSVCEIDEKLGQLLCFLGAHSNEKCIVYFLTGASVMFYFHVLRHIPQMQGCGLEVRALYGRMKQEGRGKALKAFADAQVPIEEAPVFKSSPATNKWLRSEAETDREVMLKGVQAFVSYVRGYRNHQCSFIFRMEALDLGRLANAFALLRLPKMPEIRRARTASLEQFVPSKVDPEAVKYRTKCKEKVRRATMKKRREAAAAAAAAKVVEVKKRMGSQDDAARKKRPRNARRQNIEECLDDYVTLKRLKKGKITEHEFDEAMGVDLNAADGRPAGGGNAGTESGPRPCQEGREGRRGDAHVGDESEARQTMDTVRHQKSDAASLSQRGKSIRSKKGKRRHRRKVVNAG
eukprot:evm.model.scf_621EXC.6 EVM.evm.TU.scf_621EXC.6   scf_621EXC:66270-74354(-)